MSSEKILIWMCNRVIWGFFPYGAEWIFFFWQNVSKKCLTFGCVTFFMREKNVLSMFFHIEQSCFFLCVELWQFLFMVLMSLMKKKVQKIPFWIIFFVPCGDQREKNYFSQGKCVCFFCFSQRILFFLIKQFCVCHRVERYIFSEKISNRKKNMWNWVKKKINVNIFFLTFSEFLREKWRKIFSLKTQPEKENLCAEPSEFLFFMEKTKWRRFSKKLNTFVWNWVKAECIFFSDVS